MFWGFGRRSGPKTASEPNPGPYRAFTNRFDEIISARQLARDLGLTASNRPLLDQIRASTPARIAATQRSLAFQSRYRQGHDLGADPMITLLVDHSGSMRGPKALAAATLVDIAASILEHARISFDVLGFTTSSWHGGKSRRLWRSRGEPPHPGRLCDLRHIVYADASNPSSAWQNDMPLMLSPEVLKENIDGEALQWARDRALQRNPTSWICILVSDGVPMDDATVAANGGEANGWYLYKHLSDVVADFGKDPRIRLGCLSLDYDVTAYFSATRRVATLEHAPSVVFDLLEDLIWSSAETYPD